MNRRCRSAEQEVDAQKELIDVSVRGEHRKNEVTKKWLVFGFSSWLGVCGDAKKVVEDVGCELLTVRA